MKHTLYLAAILGITLVYSCKKDRTCECSVTKTGTSTTTAALTFSVQFVGNVPVIDTSFVTPVNEFYSYDRSLSKVTRRQAKNNCIGYSEPYQERSINEAPPLQLTTLAEGTRKYDCKLK